MKFSSIMQNNINVNPFLFKLKIMHVLHPKATQRELWFGQLEEPLPRGMLGLGRKAGFGGCLSVLATLSAGQS